MVANFIGLRSSEIDFPLSALKEMLRDASTEVWNDPGGVLRRLQKKSNLLLLLG